MTNTDFVWSRRVGAGLDGQERAGAGLDGQEAAWTGKSRQADRHEQAWSKLGTRLDLMPLPMMEA